jgi:hypothetical protein
MVVTCKRFVTRILSWSSAKPINFSLTTAKKSAPKWHQHQLNGHLIHQTLCVGSRDGKWFDIGDNDNGWGMQMVWLGPHGFWLGAWSGYLSLWDSFLNNRIGLGMAVFDMSKSFFGACLTKLYLVGFTGVSFTSANKLRGRERFAVLWWAQFHPKITLFGYSRVIQGPITVFDGSKSFFGACVLGWIHFSCLHSTSLVFYIFDLQCLVFEEKSTFTRNMQYLWCLNIYYIDIMSLLEW